MESSVDESRIEIYQPVTLNENIRPMGNDPWL
jgi:hypothetical protein